MSPNNSPDPRSGAPPPADEFGTRYNTQPADPDATNYLVSPQDPAATNYATTPTAAPRRAPEGHERYHFTEFIAHGGMGEVWRGRDTHLGRDVALKVVRRGIATGDSLVRLRE